uniref:Uncharacterized protein n=1 Tax=Tetradesmus obliquus TaxID=3088 RepID=A0A383WC07_TETOB
MSQQQQQQRQMRPQQQLFPQQHQLVPTQQQLQLQLQQQLLQQQQMQQLLQQQQVQQQQDRQTALLLAAAADEARRLSIQPKQGPMLLPQGLQHAEVHMQMPEHPWQPVAVPAPGSSSSGSSSSSTAAEFRPYTQLAFHNHEAGKTTWFKKHQGAKYTVRLPQQFAGQFRQLPAAPTSLGLKAGLTLSVCLGLKGSGWCG